MHIFRKYYKVLFFLLCIIFPLFFYGGPAYDSPRLLDEIWNLGHFFYFGLFALLLDDYLELQNHSYFFRVCANIGVLLFVGTAIELIQLGMVDRIFSLGDVFRDVSGGCVVLCWRMSSAVSRWQLRILTILAIGLVLLNLLPLSVVAFDEYSAYRDFPLLSGFESRLELDRWGGDIELAQDSFVARQGNYAAKIALTTKQYSGVSLHYFPGDWSEWNKLVFSVYNPGPLLELHFRVHDNQHTGDKQQYDNRFNGSTVLQSGWNEVIIPMSDIANGPRDRQMDLTKIRGFGLFVIRQSENRTLYLDNVCLQEDRSSGLRSHAGAWER